MSLDDRLLNLSRDPQERDIFTIRNACEGVGIFGGTGSGKTSGSGATLIRSYLKAGFGGLVLTVKPEERKEWQDWAAETGRSDDLIIFSPNTPYRFDFLLYEQQRGNISTLNVVDMLMTALEISNGKKDQGGGDNQFWQDASLQLLSKSIDLLLLAKAPLTIDSILKIINTAPTTIEQTTIPEGGGLPPFMQPINQGEPNPRFKTEFAACYYELSKRAERGELSEQARKTGALVTDYFLKDYATLGERTRSSVKLHIATMLYQLVSEDIGLLLCGGQTGADEIPITPEQTYLEGKIIILDMPVMMWKKAGQLLQGLFKYLFQRCIERRDFKQHTRPVFLWSDEAQYFLTEHDQLFLTTARSSGCCTVLLTQNIENYYNIIGEHATRSLLGNLQTKIFHQNSDLATNNYGSDVIGSEWRDISSSNHSPEQASFGSSQQFVKIYPAEDFNFLRTGGTHNDLQVGGIMVRSGRKWAFNHQPFLEVIFRQQ